MSVLLPVAFVLVFVAIVGTPIVLLVHAGRRNRALRSSAIGDQLASLAEERGWTYVAEDKGYLDSFTMYPLTRGGRHTPAFDLVTGSHRDREFSCFQFAPPRSTQAGEGQSAYGTYLRVFIVWLPTPIPVVTLSGKGAGPRWFSRFATGDETFDKEFQVGCAEADENVVDALLTAPVRQWLLQHPPLAGSGRGMLRFDQNVLIGWYEEKKPFEASSVVPHLDYLCDLFDLLPPVPNSPSSTNSHG